MWSFSSFAVVFMEPSCSFSLHQPVLDLALLSGTFVPVARSHSFQRRVRSLLANIHIARPCGRSCVCSSEPCPSATHRATPPLSRRPHRESVLRTSLSHLPSASRARHRLPATFEMLGLCCCCHHVVLLVRDLVFSPRRWRIRR